MISSRSSALGVGATTWCPASSYRPLKHWREPLQRCRRCARRLVCASVSAVPTSGTGNATALSTRFEALILELQQAIIQVTASHPEQNGRGLASDNFGPSVEPSSGSPHAGRSCTPTGQHLCAFC